jgi:ankyrin repeat protein
MERSLAHFRVVQLVNDDADKIFAQHGKDSLLYFMTWEDLDVWGVAVLKYLVHKGANVNAKDGKGFTPLHNVAIRKVASDGNVEAVKFLVANGANVNAKNNLNMTPLHRAALSGNIEVVKILVSSGANVNAMAMYFTPQSGQYVTTTGTALDMARDMGHADVVEYLYGIEQERFGLRRAA